MLTVTKKCPSTACTTAVCEPVNGECVSTPLTGGCDDGDACTTGDVCTAGACAGTAVDCSALSGPCAVGLCVDGDCERQTQAGAACDDGDPCTTADQCGKAGTCRGSPGACACSDASDCDDGLACTNDRRLDGFCSRAVDKGTCWFAGQGFASACATPGQPLLREVDGEIQTVTCLVCDPTVSALTPTPVVCDDQNPCTADACVEGVGCTATADDTATCDDGDACSRDDHCAAGACVGSCECRKAADCGGDAGACRRWACQGYQCVSVAAPAKNGDSCDDGLFCASDDDCADGRFCTVPGNGQCVLRSTAQGRCWSDADCFGLAEVCVGVDARVCGAGTAAAGTCEVQIPTGCCGGPLCDPGKSCWGDFCLAPAETTGCLVDASCTQVGWVCQGAVPPDTSCLAGGSPPVFGQCVPKGPGGACVVATSVDLGSCGQSLGWGWTGTACAELFGCDCGPVCDGVFPTADACDAACSPPACCADDAACGVDRRCIDGHCVAPPPDGFCYAPNDCDPGQVCAAELRCPCGQKGCGNFTESPEAPPFCDTPPCPGVTAPAPGVCVDAPVCCDTGGACPEGLTCVAQPWGGSRCLPTPQGADCWTNADCGAGDWCTTVPGEPAPRVCSCTDDECVPVRGECTPIPAGCCTDTAECPDGTVCTVAPPGVGSSGVLVGQCLEPPQTAGQCYDAEQCAPDYWCVGFGGIPCGQDPAAGLAPPGVCTEKDGQCCGDDASCAPGFVCARSALGGACKPAPDVPGACWDASDCPAGELCFDALACGDCADCDSGGVLGSCGAPTSACCADDSDCAPGEWCTAVPPGTSWALPGAEWGQCVPAVTTPNACFRSSHCAPDQLCLNFSGYPCTDPPPGQGGAPAVWPGSCQPADGACCTSDAACPEMYRCLGALAEAGQPGLCKPMLFDGTCWSDLDCSDDQHCEGNALCGCAFCEGLEALGTCVPD